SVIFLPVRSACDQVWLPMVCPAAATCLRISGCQVACLPMGKKIALVQCDANAASTAGVWFGQGPSSKESTTSWSRRKSWLLKCSKPNPGPPVVSISTVRATPSAFGLPAHTTGGGGGGATGVAATGAGATGAGAAVGAGGAAPTAGAAAATRAVGTS